ncbi:molybdate ABC transporter substrate-binding protein [Leeia sp. TBRC 13508]|uniref:Molybdate ABC transporter substrate-binding protein n=1 Tax=Leeia speluncae TaxID=2884804 RepID=A0ABS8D4J9_9NEIS|nr:molybdate ABC transporter substrate-binding protein [Leeia speluncae]MCB6183144.1 molybdate ABC transporter substrate-binding protein [Leeia speluncae]
MLRSLSKIVLSASILSLSVASHAEELTVSAAASLTNAFKQIAQAFESSHPNDKIQFNFAASDVLVQQISQGAPVDVLATADEDSMDKAASKQLIDKTSRVQFAGNSLVLITPVDTKVAIKSLTELNNANVQKIAVGNPASVPAGRYTKDGLSKLKLWATVEPKAVYAQSVRQALDYVARSEVEAGFVYGTDALIMKDKVKVVLRVPLDESITYPTAIVSASTHKKLAGDFVRFLQSAEGQSILGRFGFTKP